MAMPIPPVNSCPDTDVLVVGHGLLPQVLAVLLAQQGWLTTLADPLTHSESFPRIVELDAETLRVLARSGIADTLPEIAAPATELDVDHPVLRFRPVPGVTLAHPPALESALLSRALHLPNLQVLRGRPATLIVDRGPFAESVIGDQTITSSWVVGCDDRHRFHHNENPAGTETRWRSGRVMLVDGTAHLRDAANLAWKLDLVLRERAHEALLDTYPVERTSPGWLLPGAQVLLNDVQGSFDDVLGPGFVLLTTFEDVRALLGPGRRAFLRDIDTKVVRVLPAGSTPQDNAVVDLENVYLPFLAEAGAIGAMVRPDHYLFGTAAVPGELVELVDDLRAQLFPRRMRPRPIE